MLNSLVQFNSKTTCGSRKKQKSTKSLSKRSSFVLFSFFSCANYLSMITETCLLIWTVFVWIFKFLAKLELSYWWKIMWNIWLLQFILMRLLIFVRVNNHHILLHGISKEKNASLRIQLFYVLWETFLIYGKN